MNDIMDILGNSVRRTIIHKLCEGPDYALRMSKELRMGQQLVSKHLKILEENGLVDVSWAQSDRGAKKKMYSLNKYYSVRVDFAPNIFNESLTSFDDPMEWIKDSSDLDEFERKLTDSLGVASNEKLNPLSLLVSEIDENIKLMEKKRARLLFIRNYVMKEVSKVIDDLDRKERQLVHHLVDRGPSSVENISRHLHLREESVRDLLKELVKRDLLEEEKSSYKIQNA